MPTHNFQDLEKSTYSRDPKTDEACWKPIELSIDISALHFLQDSRGLSTPASNQLLIQCSLETRIDFDRGSGCSVDRKHGGFFWEKEECSNAI